MVARLCRLRLALLLSVFHGPFTAVLRRVLLAATAAAGIAGLSWAPLALIESSGEREAIDTVIIAIVIAVPTVSAFFFHRSHLEPRQFAAYPAHWLNTCFSLLISTVLSWPVIWLITGLTIFVMLRPELHSAGPWLVVSGAVIVLVTILGTRVASGLSYLIVPPRSRGVLRAAGALLVVSLLPVLVFAIAETLRSPGRVETSELAHTLVTTPFGAPHAAVLHAVSSNFDAALSSLVIPGVYFFGLLVLWVFIVWRSLVTIAKPQDPLLSRRSMGWFDRFSARPASVIGARALTYWARDPRYRVALAAAPIAAVLAVVALTIAGVDSNLVALVPLPIMLLLLGWSIHNDLASDSTAIWLHIASGTRGYQDRAGRLVPVLLIGFVLLLVGSSLTVTAIGDWRTLPAIIGMNLAVLLIASGVASAWSAIRPYPTTRPGDSPFAQPSSSGRGGGAAQTLSMLLTVVLIAPVVWVAFETTLDPTLGTQLFSLAFGGVYGAVVLGLGVLFGSLVFDRVGPDYVALTQTFD